MLSQWIAFGVLMLMIVGLTYGFLRKGVGIRPDSDKPPSDLGGLPNP